MRAWVVQRPGAADEHPLSLVQRPDPSPGAGEVLVRVQTCGVCRTDLHLAEGDLPPKRPLVVPGHEVVGLVEAIGDGAKRFEVGERIGIPWLRSTCGKCRFCRSERENLCVAPLFTGWDQDGGYAELAVVPERYAYRLPGRFSDSEAAPLLCAGIIGYRALRASGVAAGGRVGIYGFGASAHLAAQVAIAEGTTVHVLTRSAEARKLALELGCASARGATDQPPEPLDGSILFAPSGDLVPVAMSGLDRGGTLAVAGIYLSDIPVLRYEDHLFEERKLRSVTANTRADGEAFLDTAARIGIRVTTQPYRFEDAHQALSDLANDRVSGAAVLQIGQPNEILTPVPPVFINEAAVDAK
jgi:propanol-preferring alcohol dehydrogenase